MIKLTTVFIAAAIMLPGIAIAASVELPSEASGLHDDYCRNEWTKRGVLDNSMFRYCIEQEHEGYQKLQNLTSKYDLPWMGDVVGVAVQEWTKRGVRQDSMVAFNVEQQVDAYLDYEYAKKQPNFNEAAFNQCIEELPSQGPDWSQGMFCYKQKTE